MQVLSVFKLQTEQFPTWHLTQNYGKGDPDCIVGAIDTAVAFNTFPSKHFTQVAKNGHYEHPRVQF